MRINELALCLLGVMHVNAFRSVVGLTVVAMLLVAGAPAAAKTRVAVDQEPQWRCPAPGAPGQTELENLGPAITGFPINNAERIGDRLYIFSLSLNPSRIVEYDLVQRRVTHTVLVPTGTRTWATTVDGTDLYFGQWGAGAGQDNFYRYDTTQRRLEGIASYNTQGEFFALERAADGRIYAGTARAGVLYAYDPATGDIEEVVIEGATGGMTALAAAGDDLYVGQGRGRAGLFKLDLDTYEAADITPPEIRDGVSVHFTMATTDEHVAFGTQQEPGRFTIMDTDDPASYESIAFDGEAIIGAVTFAGEAVFFNGLTSGKLYRYDLATREVEHVATPVPHVPARRSFVLGGALIGASVPGTVWEYDLATSEVAYVDLIGAGAQGAAEQPQSLAVTPSNVVVGKNNGVQVTPLNGRGEPGRFVVPGEAKAMVTVGKDVYVALYPNALLWRYDGKTGTMGQVANWLDVHNRPRVAYYHKDLDRVLVGISSDYGAGGALASHHRRSGKTLLFERPFGTDSPVDSITGWRGKAVIGGISANAPLALIEPVTGRLGWMTTPVPGGGNIVALVTDDRVIHGLTANGTVFTVDAATGNVRHVSSRVIAGSAPGELLLHDKHLYAVSRQQLVKLPLTGRDAFKPVVVVDALAGDSFNRPPLRRGPDCSLYLFTGRDLLRVSDGNGRSEHA